MRVRRVVQSDGTVSPVRSSAQRSHRTSSSCSEALKTTEYTPAPATAGVLRFTTKISRFGPAGANGPEPIPCNRVGRSAHEMPSMHSHGPGSSCGFVTH